MKSVNFIRYQSQLNAHEEQNCYNNLSVQTSYVNKHALEDAAPHNSVALQDNGTNKIQSDYNSKYV